MNDDEDYWIPQATPTGQIFYINTETGETSHDLPQEADKSSSDYDLEALSHTQVLSKSRSGSIAALGLAAASTEEEPEHSPVLDAPIQCPVIPENAPHIGSPPKSSPNTRHTSIIHKSQSSSHLPRRDSAIVRGSTRPVTSPTSPFPTNYSPVVARPPSSHYRNGLVSPSSAELVPPTSPLVKKFPSLASLKRPATAQGARPEPPPSTPLLKPTRLSMDLTGAERLAQSLQRTLGPPPPQSVGTMLEGGRDAIRDLIDNIHHNPQAGHWDHFELDVVTAVRNLMYVGGVLTGHIPSAVTPRGEVHPCNASQVLVKSARQRLSAALFKFGYSARVLQLQWSTRTVTPDLLARLTAKAEALDVALVSFAHDLQQQTDGAPTSTKRLRGVFSTEYVGLGLVGAGAGGTWKGFGWVYLEDEVEPPKNELSSEVLNELVVSLDGVEARISALERALSSPGADSVDLVRKEGQTVVSFLSAHLRAVGDIHVGQHVDLDGLHQDATRPAIEGIYAQTVDKARKLIRTLEAGVQATYDDTSLLFLSIQKVGGWCIEHGLRQQEIVYDSLGDLAAALRKNMKLVQSTLDALLSIGSRQANIARGNYRGSIRWRMVRTSLIGEHYGQAAEGSSSSSSGSGEGIVNPRNTMDVDLSFRHPTTSDSTDDASEFEFNPRLYNRHRHNSSRTILAVTGGRSPQQENFDEEEEAPTKIRRLPSSDKLRRVLGDEPPWIVLEAFDTKPWYLRPNRDPREIVIDPDGSVRGGTVSALVERLTAHEHGDPRFIKAFLMTFKTFTSVTELFRLLVERFNIITPAQLEPPQLEDWRKNKQYVIQTRVLNTLKSMITDEFVLEEADTHIIAHIRNFITTEEVIQHAAAKSIKILIERVKREVGPKLLISTTQNRPPRPIYPKPSARLHLLDIDALEVARQLTIIETALYLKLKPLECLQHARGGKAENIALVVETSNRIADWTASTVLSSTDPKRRAALIKHFIGVAYRCRSINNFTSMVAIISGLNLPSIRRLQMTWSHVNSKFMGQLATCEWIIDPTKSFNNYRSTLNSVTPPCVPFLGRLLSALHVIHHGNSDELPGGLVNFRKRSKSWEAIQSLLRWQAQPHNFESLPVVHVFLKQALERVGTSPSNRERYWNTSCELEPRERADETMSRLLEDIGILSFPLLN